MDTKRFGRVTYYRTEGFESGKDSFRSGTIKKSVV